MTPPPPDGSRDRRIEDPTNLWIVHPLGRRLLGPAVRLGVSANAVSMAGLVAGAGAAAAFGRWDRPGFVVLGLLLAVAWLVADGLDGMVARATGTAGPLGRVLDGVCDHGVFILIYVGLALSVGGWGAWALAVSAGAAHVVQSSLYEGERARYHRRARALPPPPPARSPHRSPVVLAYDRLAQQVDRVAAPFDRLFAGSHARALAARYRDRAAAPMRLLALQTANTRVGLIVLACLAGDPRLFWWAELGPLSLLAFAGMAWHRRIESALLRGTADAAQPSGHPLLSKDPLH